MDWTKAELIISKDTVAIDWLKLNVMCPVPIILDDSTIRIYAAFCDEYNRGRVGYIDVYRHNPSIIKQISEKPCLDIGHIGTFDENGVLPTCVFKEKDRLFMYYCGFQKYSDFPYTSLLGLAVSDDEGETFERVKITPILERVEGEQFIRTGATCVVNDRGYDLYYASGNTWFELYEGKMEPIYNLKMISSMDMTRFDGMGEDVIILHDDEYGITIPQLFKYDEKDMLLFSVRSKSKGYRIEYAVKEGDEWERQGEIGLASNSCGWYKEMQCFGKILSDGDDVLLFFSGNHYGIGGIGWTQMIKRN